MIYPNTVRVDRPKLKYKGIPNSNWLSGFIDGDGCSFISIYDSPKSKLGKAVQLRFRISQHERDTKLMELLIKYLGCGRIEKYSKHNEAKLVVTKFSDNTEKIIPFFNLYPLVGTKRFDYIDWCKISKSMTQGSNLTKEGLNYISSIKESMNRSREG